MTATYIARQPSCQRNSHIHIINFDAFLESVIQLSSADIILLTLSSSSSVFVNAAKLLITLYMLKYIIHIQHSEVQQVHACI